MSELKYKVGDKVRNNAMEEETKPEPKFKVGG